MDPPLKGEIKVFFINGPGHMTRMAALSIYGKIFENQSPMILTLCMQYWGLKLYKVCVNDKQGLTLIYFTPRSYLVAYAFEWGKLLPSH